MRTNTRRMRGPAPKTHEGAPAQRLTPKAELRRTVMACMLWEDQFYEDGESVAVRIADLVSRCKPEDVAAMAVEARTKMKLRHVPLFLCRELAAHGNLKAETLAEVIQRADELAEFLAIYWKEGRTPIAAAVKKGLAMAFPKFSAYSLAKYNRDGGVKLRDVLFLCHAKPKDEEQALVWKKLVNGTLEAPDTWEVALSGGADKKETWERLLRENKLGPLALLRNLRNMQQAGLDKPRIAGALMSMNVSRVLPFRFIAAANHAPQLEPAIEQAMFKCCAECEKLPGKTILLVDVSGSMVGCPISRKSELDRLDAAAALAVLAREICEDVIVYTFSERLYELPARHGFALRDAIRNADHYSTYLGEAVELVDKLNAKEGYDRLVVFTDEQSHSRVDAPRGRGYIVNVTSYQHGVGYGRWTHIDGFSESILDYIRCVEEISVKGD